MTRPLRVLLSARDPGAAHHVVAIARAGLSDDRFELDIVATGAAEVVLRGTGLAFHALPLALDEAALRAQATTHLADHAPDAVLVGGSGPGPGIDEALLASAAVPTYAFQDYWGDVNLALGPPAGTYFVLDGYAAELTRRRVGARVRVVGSPKHASYAGLDLRALRARGRAAVAPDHVLIGVFGQSLWPRAGYRRTCEALATALVDLGEGRAQLVYWPHPKESPEDAAAVREVLGAAGLELGAPPWRSTEEGLCACDLVVTGYSTCGYDQMHLNRLSPAPLGVVVYAAFDPEIRSLASAAGGSPTPPVEGGLGLVVEVEADLATTLQTALTEPARRSAWRAARSRLIAPEGAASRILGTIAEDLLGASAGESGCRAAGSR